MAGFENSAGIGVSNWYGPRDTGGSVGTEHTDDSLWELSFTMTAKSLAGTFLPPVVLPKGALFRNAKLRVDEVFTFTGTTPAVSFGASGSVGTNFYSVTAAELGTVGTKVPASVGNGTWAFASTTGTTAAARIVQALTGTTPAVTPGAGRATLILEYFFKTKI